MAALSAILFDIDDTLFATTEFARRARRNAVRAMIQAGVRAEESAIDQELREVIAEFSSNYHHHFDKLLLRLGPEAIEGLNPALVVASGVAAYHDTKFRELAPFNGVRELLSDLVDLDVQVGIITHGLTVKQAEKLVRLGLVRYLDPKAIFISDQIGISKPNPKLYSTALQSLGLEAGQVMYVGDNPTNDIDPPRGLGMITVWARSASKQREAQVDADHVIDGFQELRSLLREHYDLNLPMYAEY